MKKTLSWIIIPALIVTLSACGDLTIPTKVGSHENGTSAPEESRGTSASAQNETSSPASESSGSSENSGKKPEDMVDLYGSIRSIYEAEAPRQALVQDTDLYAAMVHGRYYDLWSRNSIYFTDPLLYGFENSLKRIREDNEIAGWLADVLGEYVMKQKADAKNYIRLLLMLIIMQTESFTQSGKTMSDFDTLKTFPDYVEDVVDIGLDFINMSGLSSSEELGYSIVAFGIKEGHLIIDSLAEYEMFQDASHNYNNTYLLLETIRDNTEDKELLKAVDYLFARLLKAGEMIFTEDGEMENYLVDKSVLIAGGDLFLNTMISLFEDSEEYADVVPMLNGLKGIMAKSFIPGYAVAKIAFKSAILAGDLLFGTTNSYNRYAEMKCLSEIASSLRNTITDPGYLPAFEKGSIARAEKAVPLMQFYLLTCMRGEYCAAELIMSDGGAKSELLGAEKNKIQDWLDTRIDLISGVYGDVSRILCTGNEVYYRYLEDEIIPEYGWAKMGTLEFEVRDLSSSRDGNMADGLKNYKDSKTGETGTGVVSAIVRDFDGDGVNDMLVLFLDTAPIDDTALSPVYKNATAVVLRAKLYTMQYNARPDDEPTAASSGMLSDKSQIPSMRQFFLDNISRWIEVNAEEWRMIDRYTVYETDCIDLAAEFYGLGYGSMTAGLYWFEDVLFFYTSEQMDDYTTYGPGVYRLWHVEEGRFVFDYASRSIGWGQGSFKIDLGDNQTDYGPMEGSIESGILMKFSSKISRYYNQGTPAFQTELEDRTYIRKVLEEGEGILSDKRPEEPVRTKKIIITQDNPHKDVAKGVAEEIAALSGVGMSWSGESQPTTDGSYWISYKGPGGTELTVRINLEGKIIGVTVEGKQSERYGEWTKVKDAALNCGSLGLPDDVKSSFKGGECSAGLRKDYDWGYVLAGNMNSIFIRIVWE